MAGASVNVRCLTEHPLMPIFREDDRRTTHSPGIGRAGGGRSLVPPVNAFLSSLVLRR
jgi:hypothetical protein